MSLGIDFCPGKTALPMTTPFVAILLLTAIIVLGVAVFNQIATASKYRHGERRLR